MALNINLLTQNELTVISTCQFDQEILAVQRDTDGPKIIKLSRDQVTCWQLFLRFFGLGKLASTDVHLASVTAHLNQYNWHEEIEPGSLQYNCYLKVCEIANKALVCKQLETLYTNVAKESRDIVTSVVSGGLQEQTVQKMHWNPKLQVKHLLGLADIRCDYAIHGSLRDQDGITLHNHFDVPLETFRTLTLLIRIKHNSRGQFPSNPAHELIRYS